MSELTIIAKISAVKGRSEEAKKHLMALIAPTLNEAGCIQYDLHQDNNDPHMYYFYEIWESMEHLKAHGASDHILAMRAATKDCVIKSELSFLTKIKD